MGKRLLMHMNWGLIILTVILFFIGVANLYSASAFRVEGGLADTGFYQRQLLWGLIGLCGMVCAMIFDYRHLRTLAIPFFILTLLLLIAVFPLGISVNNARRWLSFGFFNLQPSELAKISILIIGAHLLSRTKSPLGGRELITILVLGLLPAVLILKQPDLGTTLNLLLLLAGIILFRGLKLRVFIPICLLLPVAVFIGWEFMLPYQQQRVLTFLNHTEDPLGTGWQIKQSLITVGSGQLWGKGFLAGTQNQLRFLPEKHSDFAVAVFGEEWGFVGCVALMALFCLFLLSIYTTARDAKDRFGSFLAVGVFFYFFWQILINTGMVLGLMPVVGIPLPFISYGGSATLVNFCLIGLVLNVSMRRFLFKNK